MTGMSSSIKRNSMNKKEQKKKKKNERNFVIGG